MTGTGREIVIRRHEWVCPAPVHHSEMDKVIGYMRAKASNLPNANGNDVWVQSADDDVIVWFEERVVSS